MSKIVMEIKSNNIYQTTCQN